MEPRRIVVALVTCAVLQAAVLVQRADTGGSGANAELGINRRSLSPTELAPGVGAVGPDQAVAVVRTPRGIVTPVLGERDGAWVVSTPCGREAVVPLAYPLRDIAVVLDPGHGGFEPGAVGPNGMEEADLNLAVARHAAQALRLAGIPTLLTREADHPMTLSNRAQIAVGLGAAAIVSVHHNAGALSPSPGPGSEAYYQVGSAPSQRLAGLVWEEAVAALSVYEAEWVGLAGTSVTWRTNANGDDWFGMLRLPRPVPAAIAEFAYLSNDSEAALLADPDFQKVEGEALARAVARFLHTDDPGSGFTAGGRMAPRPGSTPDFVDCDDPPL